MLILPASLMMMMLIIPTLNVYAQYTQLRVPTSCLVELEGGQIVKVPNRDENYTTIKCEEVQEMYSNTTLAQYQDQIRDPANDKRDKKLNDFTENIDNWVESLNR